MNADEIKMAAARRVARMQGLSATERRAAAARIEADLLAEAETAERAKAAAALEAEASAERERIASVVKIGADLGRARQAARLAISTALEAVGAKALLGTLPTDMQAAPEALTIPASVGAFGTPAAMAERRRIGAILGHVEAEGRFQTATALAFQTGLDPLQAVAALLAVPRQEAQKYPSLAERSAAAGSFGPDFHNTTGMSKGERTNEMWSRAIKQANASIGAAPAPAAETVLPNPDRTGLDPLSGAAAGLAGSALADLARE